MRCLPLFNRFPRNGLQLSNQSLPASGRLAEGTKSPQEFDSPTNRIG